MEITEVRTTIVEVPFVLELYTARGTFAGKGTRFTHVVVEIFTNEGIIGLGEVVPVLIVQGATTEGVVGAINNHLGPAIIGEDPFNLEKISEKLDRVLFGNNFPKSGINIALYDIMGKKLGVPVFKFLGGRYRDRVPLMWDVGVKDPDRVAEVVEEKFKEGFRGFKIKVISKEDVKRVEAARKAAGDAADIWPDFNECFPPKDAIRVIKQMEKYNILCVEQPVSVRDVSGSAKLVAAVDVPIMPDEAINDPEDAIRYIQYRAADMIAIKFSQVGGLDKARLIAKIAEAANMPCIMSGMQELGIGSAAGAHLATATKNISYCELAGPLYHGDDIVSSGALIENGHISVLDKPGIGVEIDEKKLNKYKVKSFSTKTGKYRL